MGVETAATSDVALDKSGGALRFLIEGNGVCGITRDDEATLLGGCGGTAKALPAVGNCRDVVTSRVVGEDTGSVGTDCVAFDSLLSKPCR